MTRTATKTPDRSAWWSLVPILPLTGALALTVAAQAPAPPQPDPVTAGPAAQEGAEGAEAPEAGQEPRGDLDRWLFNPEERTRRGLEAMGDEQLERAVDDLDTALRLRPDDPVARFNAGTARLRAGRGDAAPLLEAATETGRSDLAARAHYNLGNALFEGQDLQGSIEAFKNALRADPEFEDAKFNLELAQRRLREQQQNQNNEQDPNQQQDQQDQQDQNQDGQQEQDPNQEEQQNQDPQQNQDEQNQDEQDQNQQDPQQQDGDQDPQEQDGNQDPQQGQGQPPQQQEKESPLPQFEDLPDMTAEEAAAILEAIENMEREQRQEAAKDAAKVNARGKKDW